jgi:general secretion pathway protein G
MATFAAGFLLGPLLIVSLAQTIALVYRLDRASNAQHESAVAAVREIANAVDDYRRRYHRVPSAEDGLEALTPDFLQRVPSDPWGRPFLYTTMGTDFADVLSYGADGEPTGEGANADISARYGRQGSRPPQWLRRAAVVLMAAVPLVAFALAHLSASIAAADVLAGSAFFWSILLAATFGNALASPLAAAALGASLLGLTGVFAQRAPARGALWVTLLGVAAAQVVLITIVVL